MKSSKTINKEEAIRSLLARNTEEAIVKEHLEAALQSGRKLRVKFGIDPTSPDLHLGHAAVLRKLREFQDLGHTVVLIIGDFTATIGDPSGRAEARKPLSAGEVKQNEKKYLAQAGKILDLKKAEVHHNKEWFGKKNAAFAIELASAGSIQQMLRREDFKKRLGEDRDLTLLETMYPLLQGYDSVAVKADVELGGTDQKFNLLAGRRVQRHFGMKEQDIVTVPLLEGLDGVKKMSKSLGNYVGLSESAEEMFGKIMSVPDRLVERYFALCTELPESEVASLQSALSPRDLKARLGFEIAKVYHSEKEAEKAAEDFEKVFSKKETPDDAPELAIGAKKLSAAEVVLKSGVVKSKGEAWRLVSQGGLSVNGARHADPKEVLELQSGDVLKIGKRHFFRAKK